MYCNSYYNPGCSTWVFSMPKVMCGICILPAGSARGGCGAEEALDRFANVCVICLQAQHATDAEQRKHEASAHAELERMGDAREPVRPPRPPGAPKVQLASFNDTEIVALAKGAQGGEDGVTAQAAVRAAERAAARAKERGA